MGVGTVGLAMATAVVAFNWPLLFPMGAMMGSATQTTGLATVYFAQPVFFYLVPLACLGALTALACGAWRMAALTVFICAPTLVLFSHPFDRFMLAPLFQTLLVGVVLIACLIWSYRKFKRSGGASCRFVGHSMQP